MTARPRSLIVLSIVNVRLRIAAFDFVGREVEQAIDSGVEVGFRREAVKAELPASTRLLNIPKAFCKILDRDLKAAGIPKHDYRGRTIEVYALRHKFGTMLSVAGVAPRVAQAAMRHSSIDLTMNVYAAPRLLDVQGAVESLPQFPRRQNRTTTGNAWRPVPRIFHRLPWQFRWQFRLAFQGIRSQRLSRWSHFRRKRTSETRSAPTS